MSNQDDRERRPRRDEPEEGEERRSREQQERSGPPPADKPKTISLLDLMNETEADDGRLVISEADVRAASPDEEETGPLVIPDEPLHPPSTPD
ncbi:MAG: hypothetical protein KDE09_25500, partial [Anaerolineales bacterium]|nr:hypothetical protein [Anaerolineales bacterium]